MKLDKRLDDLEDSLSPRQLVISWMREAHEYGDFISYGNWLLTQPEESYPLFKLPAHIYRASPVSRSRICEERDHAALHASYRDLLFLYHLHNELNKQIVQAEGELRFRCLYLKEVILRLSEENERQEAQAEDRKTKRRKTQGQPKPESTAGIREIRS